ARERVVFDVAASAKDFAESVALSWICVSCSGRWFGVVLQTVVLVRNLCVSPDIQSFVFTQSRKVCAKTQRGDQNEKQIFIAGNGCVIKFGHASDGPDGRPLASVAWSESGWHLQGDRTAQAVAHGRPAACLESNGRRTRLLVVFRVQRQVVHNGSSRRSRVRCRI